MAGKGKGRWQDIVIRKDCGNINVTIDSNAYPHITFLIHRSVCSYCTNLSKLYNCFYPEFNEIFIYFLIYIVNIY